MIKHGGNVNEAAIKFAIAKDKWLDLSTGLNPHGWQLDSPIPESYYQHLPYPDATFYSIANRYYNNSGKNKLLAVPGSQAAIQAIPRLLKNKKVALPVPGYEEHLYHWQQNQHKCIPYDPDNVYLVDWVSQNKPDVVVVINPNNPSGKLFDKQTLESVLRLLEKEKGLLIVDEAFIDTSSEHSLTATDSDNLIVLRSLGKFFGLPGVRVGFVKAAQYWHDQIEEYLGAWAMNGPGLYIASRCLADFDWQQQARQQLKLIATQQMRFLDETFNTKLSAKHSANAFTSTDYFISYRTSLELAQTMHSFYGQQGILVRLIDLTQANLPYEAIIRFGLCADKDVERFQIVTQGLLKEIGLAQVKAGTG